MEVKIKSYLLRRKTSEVERTFQEFANKPLEITDKPIPKISSGQLDIKLGQFTKEEFDVGLKKKKKEKKKKQKQNKIEKL